MKLQSQNETGYYHSKNIQKPRKKVVVNIMGPDDSSYKNVLKKSGAHANKPSKDSLYDWSPYKQRNKDFMRKDEFVKGETMNSQSSDSLNTNEIKPSKTEQ